MKSLLTRVLIAIAIPLVLFGCAAPPLPDVVWPEPPDPPKIKYLRAYMGSLDFKRSNVAADIVLGSESGHNLKKPMSVYVDEGGKVFVTDTAASDVFIFDPVNSKVTTLADVGTKIFYKPIGVTTDSQGRIFITDSQVDKVAMLSAEGKLISYLQPTEPFKQPTGIIADNTNKRLYIADTHTHDIRVFDLETLKHVKTIGKRGKEEGDFNFPAHISVDTKGNLYVVDSMNGRLQVFDTDGKFVRAFGQFGDAPGMFARPKGVGIDREGHIYVVDAAFNNVQIFNDEGQILLAFANYGSDRGQMILPSGLAVDKENKIYVVDSWNRRVNVYQYLKDEEPQATAPKK